MLQPSVPYLFKAVEANDKEGLRSRLAREPFQVNQTYLGRTPLHLAALDNHLQQIKDLVAAGADLKAADWQGDTPLHLAVLARRLMVTRSLLALGADPQAHNRSGATALHVAAWVGASPQLWQALLEAGADAQALDDHGRTPLMVMERLYPDLASQARRLSGPAPSPSDPG
jgi:ankyrin repeat protein